MLHRLLEQSPALAAGIAAIVGLGVGGLVVRWVEWMLAAERRHAGEHGTPPNQPGHIGAWVIVAGTGILFGGFTWAMLAWECQRAFPEVQPGPFWRYGRIVWHLVLFTLLVAATATDWREYVIPAQITLSGMLIGVAGAALAGDLQMMHLWVDATQDWQGPFGPGPFIPQWIKDHHHWHGLAWSTAGLVCGGGITWLVRALSSWLLGEEALGFGDVTLMAMVGSFIGWQPVVWVLLLAPLCGLVVALTGRVLSGKRFIPFGPYLALATLVVLFTWRWIWGFEIEWRPGTTVAVREFFGDWPALLILAAIGVGLLVLLLGLLRLYRAIPVPAAHRQTRAAAVAPAERTATAVAEPAAARLGPRLFAVIPAAGHSQRMGQPKLLLPLGGATVIARLLAALDHPAIAVRIVVVRPDDEPLRAEVQRSGGIALQPAEPPPDMRTSIEHALASIQDRFTPRPDDGWLLVPADHPVLDRGLVERVIAAWQAHRPEILVPTCGGRRGHPTVFRWNLAAAVPRLPADCGLNQLVRDGGQEVLEVELGDPALLTDLDTPADYGSLAARWPET